MRLRTLSCVPSEFVSNGLKLRVKVTPVTDSSVSVTFLPDEEALVLLLWPLEQAAIPRPRTKAAATPFRCA